MNDKTCGKIICWLFIISELCLLIMAGCSASLSLFFKYKIIIGSKALVKLIIFLVIVCINLISINTKTEWAYYMPYRFAHDSMNQRLFDIENQIDSRQITENEAKYKKMKIMNELEFLSSKPPVFCDIYNFTICFIITQILMTTLFSEQMLFRRDLYLFLVKLKNKLSYPRKGIKLEIKELEKNSFVSEQSVKNRISPDFFCTVRFGNLLTNEGDILLCPIGENFIPSNPLAYWVMEKEGSELKKILKNINEINFEKTEHTIFIPCKKLKYKGIIFVGVDFYSDNRIDINVKRISEAFQQAQKLSCTKLSCPQEFLYDFRVDSYRDLFAELDKVIKETNIVNEKISFEVEFVIKPTRLNYERLSDYEWIFE